MITQNINTLFSILRTALQGTPLSPEIKSFTEEEVAQLFALAKIHDLSHIVANVFLENNLFSENTPKYQRAVFKALYRYEGQAFELSRLCELLSKKEIPCIPLKGSVLRKYYPLAWMRTSCDIDILVKKEDLIRAKEAIIEELLYEYREDSKHDITLFSKGGVCLELHFDLQESDFREIEILKDIWTGNEIRQTIPFVYEMTNELFVLYHIYHMAKHFMNGGCGIRPFIDLWIIKHNMPYDWDKLEKLLSKAGLLSFAKSALLLSDVWFSDGSHTELTEEMENYILSAGVYGTTENRVAIAQSARGGKLKFLLSRSFPSFEYMANRNPVLRKCPILLPWFYIVRWFRFLLKKEKSNAITEIRLNSSVSEEKTARLHTMCEELSLL